MKKLIFLIPLLLAVIGCEKEQVSTTENFNTSQLRDDETSARNIDIAQNADTTDTATCVTIDTLERNADGCCVYEICVPLDKYSFSAKGYELVVVGGNATVTFVGDLQNLCYEVVVCHDATLRLVNHVNNWPFGPVYTYIVCEFELNCCNYQDCPLELEFDDTFPEDDPRHGCLVYNYTFTADPPPGCEWLIDPGPSGSVNPWGQLRVCPGETVVLQLECGDSIEDVCNLDLSCTPPPPPPPLTCEDKCEDICFEWLPISQPGSGPCFEFTIEIFGDPVCLGDDLFHNIIILKDCPTEIINTDGNKATFQSCNCTSVDLQVIVNTAECGLFEIGPYDPYMGETDGKECD